MPFKSAAQRRFLQANEPEVYNRWKKKYGYSVDSVKRRSESNDKRKKREARANSKKRS